MKKFRWQILIVLITGMVVGLLLFLQKSGGAPQVENTPSPITGGIYTEALIGNFSRLNPMLDRNNQPDQDVDHLIFNSLIQFDATGSPEGDLAESWSYSGDGTKYTFSLKPGVYWHDGEPLTSQDVLFTVSLLQSNSSLIPADLRTFWPEISVAAPSESIIEFTLPESFAPFLDYLSFQILPSHLLGNLSLEEMVDHPFNLAPVGSGPFKFNKLILKDGVVSGVDLLANETYFGGRPYLDEVVFQYYPTDAAALSAYQAGEIDGISNVSKEILPQVLEQPGLNLYSSREARMSMIFLNLNSASKGFLKQADFRKALMYATNRQFMIDSVMDGQAVLADGPILVGNWAYYADQGSFRYDPDAARQSIAALGMTQGEDGILRDKDGIEVRLTLLVQDEDLHRAIAEIVQQGWQSVGVATDLLYEDYETVASNLASHNFDAALVDINFCDTPDPDPYPFWDITQADAGQNYSQWDNLTASEYLVQARIETNITTRTKLYRNFQILFHEDLPSLPLFNPIYNYAVKDSIKNVSIGPIYRQSDRFDNIVTWYILAGSPTNMTPVPTPN